MCVLILLKILEKGNRRMYSTHHTRLTAPEAYTKVSNRKWVVYYNIRVYTYFNITIIYVLYVTFYFNN